MSSLKCLEWHLVEGQVIGMDVHVPEAGHEIPAFEIDHLRVASAARLSAWQDGADAGDPRSARYYPAVLLGSTQSIRLA